MDRQVEKAIKAADSALQGGKSKGKKMRNQGAGAAGGGSSAGLTINEQIKVIMLLREVSVEREKDKHVLGMCTRACCGGRTVRGRSDLNLSGYR